MGIYEEENRYEVSDKPRAIGKCEACEDIMIYEDMEHYDVLDELVCVDCIDEYIKDRFYRN